MSARANLSLWKRYFDFTQRWQGDSRNSSKGGAVGAMSLTERGHATIFDRAQLTPASARWVAVSADVPDVAGLSNFPEPVGRIDYGPGVPRNLVFRNRPRNAGCSRYGDDGLGLFSVCA